MKVATTICLGLSMCLFTSACKSNKMNPEPLFLKPVTALDPPGTEGLRKAELERRQKEGRFATDAELELVGGKAFFFAKNPEIDGASGGKMMEAKSVKIVLCEGLYYYVKTPDGDGGYLRESDLIDPNDFSMMGLPLTEGYIFGDPNAPMDDSGLPLTLGSGSELFPDTPLFSDNVEGAQVLTNAQGRVVTMVQKKTEAGKRFSEEEQKIRAASPSKDSSPAIPTPAPSKVAPGEIPDLPDSTL